jgi:hypothetical protein
MLGRVISAPNNVPVARIMACVEVVMRVGPGRDSTDVCGFANALVDGPMSRVESACDNRDFFQLRRIRPIDVDQIQKALRAACGEEATDLVDWATLSYFDCPDRSTVPDVMISCALGRCLDGDRDVGVSLVIGTADSASWERLFALADRLATGWAGLWCSITVGRRFCPLDYNGFHLGHQAIHRMAKRMPTVDVGDTLGIHTSHWTKRLRTVAWATFVSREFHAQCETDHCGRLDWVDVRPLSGGGMCARLRDEPRESESPEPELRGLIEADGLFRPVRALHGIAFLPPWSEQTSREWLGRLEPGGTARMFLPRSDPFESHPID